MVALDAVIILPSSEVGLDWLAACDHHHIVSADAFASTEQRKHRALDIVGRA
jgi:hypothetical protein